MLMIDLPGKSRLVLEHLVLDMNGTVATDGVLLDGVTELIAVLREDLDVVLVTADTHGGAAQAAREIGASLHVISRGDEGAQKAALVDELGAPSVIAIGNGANDVAMLGAAKVGVCVIGTEGAAGAAVSAADVVTMSIVDALELFVHTARLVATLRR